MAGFIQTSGQLLLPNGTVSAPALRMSDNATTGWYFSNGLNISLNGVKSCGFPGSGVAFETAIAPSPTSPNNTVYGDTTLRWSAIWAVNGTVHTSFSEFKHDIIDLPLSIEVPLGINFKWKDTEGTDRDRPYMSFLADSLPDEAFAVDKDGNVDHAGVKAVAVIGILCSHVRALRDQIESLETSIAAYKSRGQ